MDVPRRATVRLRRLASELRSRREAAGLSREEVVQRTGVSRPTLVRLETARSKPQPRTLGALLDLYGVRDPIRQEFIALADQAGEPNWLHAYEAELPEHYTTYIGFEAEARSVRNYECLYVPGLLQTEAYARAVIAGTLPGLADDDIERRAKVRIQRQASLTKPNPLKLWAIVDEAAIRRLVGGPAVMAEQLAQLEDLDPQVVTFQVIPYRAGAHPGMQGSFVVMDFEDPADSDIVYTDSAAGDLFLEKDVDVRRYASMFDHLRAMALSPKDTVRLIEEAGKQNATEKGSGGSWTPPTPKPGGRKARGQAGTGNASRST